MKENKKKMISLGVTVITLLLIVVGATYAYFAAQIDNGKSTDVDITAESVDSLTFTTGDPISFKITQDNFKQGGNNLSGSTTATASLIAGKDRTATYNYNIYLNIAGNSFIYTKDTNTPELLLKVTGPNGEVTSISGLTYNSALGGYDITTKNGQIKLANNYEISTTTNKIDEWQIEVIFRNLNGDQTANSGKVFRAEVIIQKEEGEFNPTLADVCHEGDNLAGCLTAYANELGPEKTNIYKHDSTLANSAEDNSYRYSGEETYYGDLIKSATTYGANDLPVFNIYCYSSNEYMSNNLQKIADVLTKTTTEGEDALTEDEQAYFESVTTNDNFEIFLDKAEIIKDAKEKGIITDKDMTHINNYVCFGSDAEACSNDSLYRIIGVFGDQVKLIKASYATTDQLGTDGGYRYEDFYYWNNERSNDWETSLLNKTNLNTNFINYLIGQNPKWVSMIAETKWNIGIVEGGSSAKTFYDAEIKQQTSITSKIGLMYASDYGYATIPSNWSINSPTIKENNWMNNDKLFDWTMTRGTSNSVYGIDGGIDVGSEGMVRGTDVYHNDFFGRVRPVMYLENNVSYVSGVGSYSEPFRISQ